MLYDIPFLWKFIKKSFLAHLEKRREHAYKDLFPLLMETKHMTAMDRQNYVWRDA